MSGDDIVIKVSNLSKCYHIYDKPSDRVKQFIVPKLCRAIPALKNLFPTPHSPHSTSQESRTTSQSVPTHHLPLPTYYREFWALKDLSFEIKKGETMGIIGRNGSGKSTLLQLICGTLNATTGSVQTNGRIAALLELGSGFNPEFTGRENVYMNGAILGLSQDEIDARFEDVAAFADIGAFIEQPAKTYSSGMFVRLAFASNIMSKPDIMIVDEALAVGDMSFQAKCMTALTRIQENGATVLFVAHDIGAVKSLCSRGVYLEQGQVKAIGSAAEVAERYVRTMREGMNEEQRKYSRVSTVFGGKTSAPTEPLACEAGAIFKTSAEFASRVAQFRYGTGDVKVAFVELLNLNDEHITFVEFNQKIKARVFIEAYAEKSISVNVSVFDDKKNNVMGCGFGHVGQPNLAIQPAGRYLVEFIFHLPLQEGNYSIRVNITAPTLQQGSPEFLDVINDAVVFRVASWGKARVWSKVHMFAELTVKQLKD